jgi:hypothetical protein
VNSLITASFELTLTSDVSGSHGGKYEDQYFQTFLTCLFNDTVNCKNEIETVNYNHICISLIACYMFQPSEKPSSGN